MCFSEISMYLNSYSPTRWSSLAQAVCPRFIANDDGRCAFRRSSICSLLRGSPSGLVTCLREWGKPRHFSRKLRF